MSQHDLEAKSYPAHNFVFLSRILKLFHRNNHHMCCLQDLGRYIEGQGHSMVLQQHRVRPITYFKIILHTEIITILRQCVVCKIWVDTLKVKVTA